MSTPTNQAILIDYQDSVNSNEVNDRLPHIASRGIYSGGYLTITNNTTVSLSALTCEIGDATHQIYGSIGPAATSVTVSTVNTTVVLRWAYISSPSTAITITAVAPGSVQANDLIVGVCVYVGSTLTSINYALRSNPISYSKNLLVEPTVAASMAVRVRGGKINTGTGVLNVVDQLTSTITAPVSNPRIDVVACDNAGVISIIPGVEGATPAAPDYAGKLGLAEITLQTASTTITATMIRNVANANLASAVAKSYVDARTIRNVVFTQGYTLSVGTLPFSIRFPMAGTITGVYGYMSSAPTGANIIVDVLVGGTSIWNAGVNRLNIVAGATTGSQTIINNTAITANQVITVSIAQVGSTLPGDSLTLNIIVTV